MNQLPRVALATSLALALSMSNIDGAHVQTLASTLEVYVFPAEGQSTAQQYTDEATCYDWAVGNTQSDPFALAKQEQAEQQQAAASSGQRQQATAQQMTNFNKAFSVCLEAKNDMVNSYCPFVCQIKSATSNVTCQNTFIA